MAERRIVRRCTVHLEGRKYSNDVLAEYEGAEVLVFVDNAIMGADAVCLTPEGEFICNAHNLELWAAMTGASLVRPIPGQPLKRSREERPQ